MSKTSHWYTKEGTACHEVPYADPGKGMRSTTLADARKLKLLPSVTTICNVLDKPALTEWKIRNAIEAALTTPRNPDESLDDFATRVLAVDTESISDTARGLGMDIHDGIESLLAGKTYHPELALFIQPAAAIVTAAGRVIATEKIVVGEGYAGKTDCITEGNAITVWDFKSTSARKLPAKSYPEHRLQLAAYAAALGNTGGEPITTVNIYISTINPGEIVVCENQDWKADFAIFKKVCELWCWQNNFIP